MHRNDDEIVENNRQQRKENREKSFDHKIEHHAYVNNESGPNRVSLSNSSSGENIDTDSDEIEDYKKNVIATTYAANEIRRQRAQDSVDSNLKCENEGRKPSGVTFDSDKHLVNEKGVKFISIHSNSEDNQYEIVRPKKRNESLLGQQNNQPSINGSTPVSENSTGYRHTDNNKSFFASFEIHRNSDSLPNQSLNNSSQSNKHSRSDLATREPYLYDGYTSRTPHQMSNGCKKTASSNTDDGTEIDDQPWSRKDGLQTEVCKQLQLINATKQIGNNDNQEMKSQTYINVEEAKPLLPQRNPPRLPPKKSSFSRSGSLQLPAQQVQQLKNEHNNIDKLAPAIPPKSISVRQQTNDNFRNINAERQFQSRPSPTHINQNGFSQNGKMHSNMVPNNSSQMQQNNNEVRSVLKINPELNRQGKIIDQRNVRSINQQSHRMQEVKSSNQRNFHDDNFSHKNPSSMQRKFQSTANFNTAGLLPHTEQRMMRANSTDALTVHGLVQSSAQFENSASSKTYNMKKAKSQIVLDDISVISFNEDGSPKQKLSDEASRGKLEMWSGLLHLLTICTALAITVPMATVSNNWEYYADHKCPLFVRNNLQHDRVWGNPSMISCYVTAYVPLLIAVSSLVLVFVHGGLLFYWRGKRKSSGFYMSKGFNLTLLFCNMVAMGVAIAVACVLTDGLRQTCLSFNFISDIEYRPTSCQNGYDGLDLNYNIEWTYYLVILAIVGAWLTVILTLISFGMYIVRAGICRCSFY